VGFDNFLLASIFGNFLDSLSSFKVSNTHNIVTSNCLEVALKGPGDVESLLASQLQFKILNLKIPGFREGSGETAFLPPNFSGELTVLGSPTFFLASPNSTLLTLEANTKELIVSIVLLLAGLT
jgi:hypothetical protein